MKANKDGWIRHRGGKCPVEAGMLIDIRCRDGQVRKGVCVGDFMTRTANHYWSHDGDGAEVMAWRPHVATTEQYSEVAIVSDSLCDAIESAAPLAENEAAQELLSRKSGFVDAVQPADGLRAIRDRIHAIDAEQKAADEAHKAATDARTAERAELVQKLAGEGLALLDKCHALMDGVEERHGEPAKNMNDPENWKEGDQVEIIWSSNGAWTERAGLIGTVQKGSMGEYWMLNFNGKARNWCCDPSNCTFKWHGRPTA